MENRSKKVILLGILIMSLLTLSKIDPSTSIAGYSVFVGLAFFFLVETIDKTPSNASGLRFANGLVDLKKPGVLPLVFLPILTGALTLWIGDLLFQGGFSAHVLGRTANMLSFDHLPLLSLQILVAALGEEIAWRGFFLGKGMKYFSFPTCMIISSLLFAAGHISVGPFALILYDVVTIFIDSCIYALVYSRSNNCLISAIAHVLCNMTGILWTLLVL